MAPLTAPGIAEPTTEDGVSQFDPPPRLSKAEIRKQQIELIWRNGKLDLGQLDRVINRYVAVDLRPGLAGVIRCMVDDLNAANAKRLNAADIKDVRGAVHRFVTAVVSAGRKTALD